MSGWKLRGCPRCSGDLYLEKDYDDCYLRCLQCGYVRSIPLAQIKEHQNIRDANTGKVPVTGRV